MAENDKFQLSKALICSVMPLGVLPIVGLTSIGGPCAGVRDAASGVFLFAASLVGTFLAVLALIWIMRFKSLDIPQRITKVLGVVMGVLSGLLNVFFLVFSGIQLVAMR